MDRNYINISSIESFFYDLLFEKVSPYVFFTSIPIDMKQEWENFCVVDIPNDVVDKHAYGSGSVLIYLYTQSLAGGEKNIGEFDKMNISLREAIESNNNPHYSVTWDASFTDFDNSVKLYCNIIKVDLLIV